MKKTFLAMLLLGGTVSMFAQTAPTGTATQGNTSTSTSTTTQPATTQPVTTQPVTTQPVTTQPMTTQPGTVQPTSTSPANGTMSGGNTTTPDPNTSNTSVNPTNANVNATSTGVNAATGVNSTTSPVNNTMGNVNGAVNNVNGAVNSVNNSVNSMNNPNATNTNGDWNGVSSTSWAPTTTPSYGWNSYGNWPNSGSLYPTTTAGGFPITPATTDASASMSSGGSYSAYGTPVSALPANVQQHFNQDFPAVTGNSYTWNQYGDWLHTYYMNNGRLWQYHYTTRGDGYALALPVIQTYVPENIIASALQKYGSSLYSIAMVKTNSGNSAYQIGLLQHGQLTSQYLDDNGASVADVWRVEDSSSMNSTQANAAMDNSSSSSTDANGQASDMSSAAADKGKSKLKIKNEDGSQTKIKVKDGQMKVKNKPATNNSSTSDQQPQQQ